VNLEEFAKFVESSPRFCNIRIAPAKHVAICRWRDLGVGDEDWVFVSIQTREQEGADGYRRRCRDSKGWVVGWLVGLVGWLGGWIGCCVGSNLAERIGLELIADRFNQRSAPVGFVQASEEFATGDFDIKLGDRFGQEIGCRHDMAGAVFSLPGQSLQVAKFKQLIRGSHPPHLFSSVFASCPVRWLERNAVVLHSDELTASDRKLGIRQFSEDFDLRDEATCEFKMILLHPFLQKSDNVFQETNSGQVGRWFVGPELNACRREDPFDA